MFGRINWPTPTGSKKQCHHKGLGMIKRISSELRVEKFSLSISQKILLQKFLGWVCPEEREEQARQLNYSKEDNQYTNFLPLSKTSRLQQWQNT